MGELGPYQIFAHEAVPIGGMMKQPPFIQVSHWRFYINVSDIKAAQNEVKSGGGEILQGPTARPRRQLGSPVPRSSGCVLRPRRATVIGRATASWSGRGDRV